MAQMTTDCHPQYHPNLTFLFSITIVICFMTLRITPPRHHHSAHQHAFVVVNITISTHSMTVIIGHCVSCYMTRDDFDEECSAGDDDDTVIVDSE